jgi:hypothetical protein
VKILTNVDEKFPTYKQVTMGLLIDKKQKCKCLVLTGIWPASLPDLKLCDFFFWGL